MPNKRVTNHSWDLWTALSFETGEMADMPREIVYQKTLRELAEGPYGLVFESKDGTYFYMGTHKNCTDFKPPYGWPRISFGELLEQVRKGHDLPDSFTSMTFGEAMEWIYQMAPTEDEVYRLAESEGAM